MEYGHWDFNVDFDPYDWFGFIYKITELDTGREYIGKKQFFSITRKIVKGKRNRKKVVSESNWRSYTGSSENLNAQILLKGKNNYKFEILSLHQSKGSLHYAEVDRQVKEDVLRSMLDDGVTKKYYNKVISGVKFIPPAVSSSEIRIKISKIISKNNGAKKISKDEFEKWSKEINSLAKSYDTETYLNLKNFLYEYNKQKLVEETIKRSKHSTETKEKIRKSRTGKLTGAENPMYGKPCYYKMDEKQIDIWKENISKATKGKPKSTEHVAKISEKNKGKQRITLICPHCNKIGRGGNMKRYHFDNCKSKK